MNYTRTIDHQTGVLVPFTNKSMSRAELPHNLVPYAEHLFTSPHGWDDGIFRSPLCCVSDYLRQNGVAPGNIRAGLLIYLGLNSVKLGFPLSIILTGEDPAVAAHLLSACKMIAPDQSFHEVHEMKIEDLYSDQDFYRNRVLICHDISTLKKVLPDILKLITEGYSERQATSKSKFGNTMQKFSVRHPRALIGIETISNANRLNHPSIINVPIDTVYDRDEISHDIFSNSTLSNTASRTIATIFGRLSSNIVSIPYAQQLVRTVVQQKPKHFQNKLGIIRKVVSLCTIINNPPQITRQELFANLIGVGQEEIYQAMGGKKTMNAKLPCIANIIQSNKVDYYVSAKILDGVIGITSDSFTDDQVKVFETVRKINFHKLKGAAINQNSYLEKLSMLPRFPAYWAYMHELLKILNEPNRFIMSVPDIERVLNQLKRNKKLGIKKGDQDKGNGFFILVPRINAHIKMPDVADVMELNNQGQAVKVLNPLTGLVEEL